MKDKLIEWVKNWYASNSGKGPIVIGISGGKDSTVVAALCAEALGKEKVFGIYLPKSRERDDKDWPYANKVFDLYCGESTVRAIGNIINLFPDAVSNQANYNLPPRIRMAMMYFYSQTMDGRVACTCNLSERMLGWETLWGDSVGDFAPLANLTVKEVLELGKELGVPDELLYKVPDDGLCGETDEEKFGFTYAELDEYLLNGTEGEHIDKIKSMIEKSAYKRRPIASFRPENMLEN